jgi:hypothetical protein
LAGVVYILCALVACGCSWLLYGGYWRARSRLLLWSSLCFACLALSNTFTFLDLILFPAVNLFVLRNVTTLTGMMFLLYGLIWDKD